MDETKELEQAVAVIEHLINAAYQKGIISDVQSSTTLNNSWSLIKESIKNGRVTA